MTLDPLCPDPTTWRMSLIAAERDRLVLHLEPRQRSVACPVCGTRSRRVHSRYRRTAWDVPWGRWPVQLVVYARRVCCDVPTCARRLFVEPFPQVFARYARQTERLRRVLLELAHATSAEMAARLAPWLGYRVSAEALLCRQRAESFVFPPPRGLGVDEFALRRGRTDGTLLVDLERRQPIEILPDTQAETLARWLQPQPQIQVISRDRAGQFAEGATVGTPQAIQGAERWHLLRTLREAVQRLRTRHPAALRAAVQVRVGATLAVVQEKATTVSAPAPGTAPLPSPREQRLHEVLARHAEGWSCRRIAQELGLYWRTVKRYVLARELPKRGAPMLQATSTVLPDLSYLEHRWQEGCRVGTQLWQELQAQGYPGSLSSVYRALKPWRPADGRRQTPTPSTRPKRYALSPRQGMWLLLQAEGDRSARDRAARPVLESAHPAIATATGLAQRFQQMVRDRAAAALEPWLQEAASSEVPEFRRFAASLRGDAAAVRAALEYPWSKGQLEGQINRVKVLKRVSYGRAQLDLLRQRILHRVVAPVRSIKARFMNRMPAVA